MLPSNTYGSYWGLNSNNKISLVGFDNDTWDNVPIGSYYRLREYYLNGITALIGDYCLIGDNCQIAMEPDKFYIKGNIESSKILPVNLNASKILDNVLKRNPRFTCVSSESDTSNKFHIYINEKGFVCDYLTGSETDSNLCYYWLTGPYIPIYEGFEFRITSSGTEYGVQEFLLTSYTFV